jgi:hypothetical protein
MVRDGWEPGGEDNDRLERLHYGAPLLEPMRRFVAEKHFGITVSDTLRMDTVKAQPVEWAWKDRIPWGMLTDLAGNPDLGKSLLLADIAARISRGWKMPPDGGSNPVCPPASVRMLSAEDDPARVIRPRLEAAGADLTRIHLLAEVNGQPPVLPDDLDTIEGLVRFHGVKLLTFDPITAYWNGKVNSHKDQDVRRVLHLLKEMAERTGAAIVYVRHLNKMSTEREPIYRGGGSIALVAAARSSLLIGPHPEDVGLRVLARIKGNLSPTPAYLGYRIQPNAEGQPRLEWTGEVEIDTADLLRHHGGRRTEALDKAKEFLKGQLAKEPRLVAEVEAAAEQAGISAKTLRNARCAMKIVTLNPQVFGGQRRWQLPTSATPATPVLPPNHEKGKTEPNRSGNPTGAVLPISIGNGQDCTEGKPAADADNEMMEVEV